MIEIKNENSVYTAFFEGRLDAPTAQKAQDEIETLLENADKEIVLDCTKLEYISSPGLRLFLRIRKEVNLEHQQGCQGSICIDRIRRILRLSQ